MQTSKITILIPEWLKESLENLAVAEGVEVSTICSDAIIEYMCSTAPDFIPPSAKTATSRSVTIRLVNRILVEAIDSGASAVLITSKGQDLVIKHNINYEWHEHEYDPVPYPMQWIYSITQRLELMSKIFGKFEVSHNNKSYKFEYTNQLPQNGLLLHVAYLSP